VDRMDEKPRDSLRLSRRFIRRRVEDADVKSISEAARVPRRTVYSWWRRFQRKFFRLEEYMAGALKLWTLTSEAPRRRKP